MGQTSVQPILPTNTKPEAVNLLIKIKGALPAHDMNLPDLLDPPEEICTVRKAEHFIMVWCRFFHHALRQFRDFHGLPPSVPLLQSLEPVLAHFQSRLLGLQNHLSSILNREIHSSFFDNALKNWQTLSAQKAQSVFYDIGTFEQEQPGYHLTDSSEDFSHSIQAWTDHPNGPPNIAAPLGRLCS
ncbi:hypothetical protein VP01_2406g3 [Puccinia sorghi]|uniref:Uncharacterized protein n=1 Tax=Puccinia sorghi TaxID=27349 RepID=A0A0L6V6K5_9BASI|nr:hypothetical protein VP01_2406g3 [Puccinia sorghi]